MKYAARSQRASHSLRGDKPGLPSQLRAGIEHLSGISMEGVRVHYGSPKPASVDAHAYAQGRDIYLARGQEHHLPHEAWHVVQQAQGRVRPTLRLNGKPINDSPWLEREADRMGALSTAPSLPRTPVKRSGGAKPSRMGGTPMQRYVCSKKSNNKGLADTMSDKRVEAKYWNRTGLDKNFAFDADETDIWAHSQSNRHAEPGVLMKSLAEYGKDQNIHIVTERKPCRDGTGGGCHQDIKNVEDTISGTMKVTYFVEHNDDAPKNLQRMYQKWWPGDLGTPFP